MFENLRLFHLVNELHREGSMPAIEKEHPLFLRFDKHFQLLVNLFEEAMDQGKVRRMPASFWLYAWTVCFSVWLSNWIAWAA